MHNSPLKKRSVAAVTVAMTALLAASNGAWAKDVAANTTAPNTAAANTAAANTAAANTATANTDSETSPDTTSPPPTAEVIITGEQPGPGLWKVTHGGTHVMWVLGTVNEIPKDVKWRSRQVEEVIAHARLVIFGENVSPKIGLFRGMLLLPAVLKARFNPDKAVLENLITPDRYERWLPQRKKYFKDDDDIERVRPMFIGMRLGVAAATAAGLSQLSVGRIVVAVAKKNNVPIENPEVKFELADPRQAIRDFSGTPRERDVGCFNAVLDNMESDMERLKLRAAAWAVGDIEAFRKVPAPVANALCIEALTSAPALQDEFAKLKKQVNDTWLWEVEKALELHDVTLVVMPLDEVLSATGRLSKLRERGYTVEEPEA